MGRTRQGTGRVGQLRCRSDIALEFGDERLRLRLDAGQLGAERGDRLDQLRRLGHRLLGRADRERRFTGAPVREGLGRGVDRPIGQRRALLGLRRVVRHGAQGGRVVGRGESGEGGSGRGEERRQVGALSSHPLQLLRCVLLELAQLVEGLGVVVEDVVDLVGKPDDADVPRTAVVDGILDLVVELLPEVERLGDLRLRRVDGAGELRGRALAVLRHGESQLLPAGGDGVVRAHERDAGLLLDLGIGERGERVGGIRGLRHGASLADGRGAACASDQSDDEPDEQGGRDHPDDDQGDAERPGAPVPLDLVRGQRDRADPVAVAGEGRDRVFDGGELPVAQRPGGVRGDVEAAALDGDREQVLIGAEPVVVRDLIGPGDAVARVGEVVDEDDEQVGGGVVGELLQARLDLFLLGGGEDVGLVGDIPGVERERIGRGRRRGGQRTRRDREGESAQRQPPFRHRVPSDRQPSPMCRVYALGPTRDSTRARLGVRPQRRHIRWKAWTTGTDPTCWQRAGASAA